MRARNVEFVSFWPSSLWQSAGRSLSAGRLTAEWPRARAPTVGRRRCPSRRRFDGRAAASRGCGRPRRHRLRRLRSEEQATPSLSPPHRMRTTTTATPPVVPLLARRRRRRSLHPPYLRSPIRRPPPPPPLPTAVDTQLRATSERCPKWFFAAVAVQSTNAFYGHARSSLSFPFIAGTECSALFFQLLIICKFLLMPIQLC